jgi:nitrite reductase/ring-hydroxylating ferredoxin subunit
MTWKRVCDATEVAENSAKTFDIDGVPVLVVNYGAGFRALPPICPHMEEPLEESGIVARCVLTCTKHLWAWNLATLEMQGETEKPLKIYETRQENGAILANIDGELTYDFDGEDEANDDFFK